MTAIAFRVSSVGLRKLLHAQFWEISGRGVRSRVATLGRGRRRRGRILGFRSARSAPVGLAGVVGRLATQSILVFVLDEIRFRLEIFGEGRSLERR